MTSIDGLLPRAEAEWRCAEYASEINLDPGGTAFCVDELIVADVSLPWRKPVFASAGFETVPAHVIDAADSMNRAIRVLGAIPSDADEARVVTYHRTNAAALERVVHRVSPKSVADLVLELVGHGLDASPGTVVSEAEPDRELLICTQGSHDRCCGTDGTRLAQALASERPDVTVRRVSHTGGHRFAPTGISLPEGRMWGGVTLADVLQIVDRTGSPAGLARHCRGWIGAAMGAEQIAERAVFAAVDSWDYDQRPRTIETIAEVDGVITCLVQVETTKWRVEVEPDRIVPTISCGVAGGLPAKSVQEYRVSSIGLID